MIRTSQIEKHLTMAETSTFKDGAWHGQIEEGGQFPPEANRYHLYIGLSRVYSYLLFAMPYFTFNIENKLTPTPRPLLPFRPPRKPNPAPQRPNLHHNPLNSKALPERRFQGVAGLEIPQRVRSLRGRNARSPLRQHLHARDLLPREGGL